MSATTIPRELYENFLYRLVGRFFKIIPLKEENSPTLDVYLRGFKIDLLGCHDLMEELEYDSQLLELVNILEYMINYDYDTETCKREVMKCITISKKLYTKLTGRLWVKNG